MYSEGMSSPHRSILILRQFIIGCLLVLAGQALWLVMLYPLVPKGTLGWAIATGSGLAATLWAGGSVLAIGWLGKQTRMRLACDLAEIVIALSLGVATFMLASHRHGVLASQYSYLAT